MEPEGVVGVLEVGALVAVHAVWVDHEVKAFAVAVKGVYGQKGVLVVDVVVAGRVFVGVVKNTKYSP